MIAPKDIKDTIDLLSWIKKAWERKTTITILLLSLLLVGLLLAYNINFQEVTSKISLAEIIGILLFLTAIFLFWHISRKPHKAQKGKIGITIAIDCETKKEQQRLKIEFINALRDEIQRGNHQQFNVIELSEYHSQKLLSSNNLRAYHKATRSHMLIYGRCRIRTHQQKETYVLDLNSSVIHTLIPVEVSAQFSKEMSAVLPKHNLIPADEEVLGFTITKDLVSKSAQYIIGIASLLSNDVQTAFNLHHGLWKTISGDLEELKDSHPTLGVMGSRLPNYLIQEAMFLASHVYLNKPANHLVKMGEFLDVVQNFDPQNYDAHLLRGIYYFLHARDIERAKREIQKAKNDRDATWQFSSAFLSAYEGNLEQAHKLYQRAARGLVPPHVPLQIETFISDVLDQEPDKIQLWYCLGMINYRVKNDLEAAEKDFSKFLQHAKAKKVFKESMVFAEQYLREIQQRKEKIT